jgi:hypothetical protein
MIIDPKIRLIKSAVKVAPAALKLIYLKRLKKMKVLANGKSR